MDLNDDDYLEQVHPNVVRFWQIFVVIVVLIVALFIATFVICGTSKTCRTTIPTLNHLMDSVIIAPFLITCINAIFGLHFIISMGVYFLTRAKAPFWSKIQFTSSLSTYISIVVTLFVFPFTDWHNDYANYLIITSLCWWMIANLMCLIRYYKNLMYSKKQLLIWNIASAVIYIIASLGYFILQTFFPCELSGILAVEIASGLSVLTFIIAAFAHIWKLEIHVRWRGD